MRGFHLQKIYRRIGQHTNTDKRILAFRVVLVKMLMET